MRFRIRLALPAAILPLLAGCHASAGSGPAPGGPTPSAATSTDAAGCPSQLTITAADNGKTRCVAVGGTVLVTSPTAEAKRWVDLEATGGVLGPVQARPPVPAGTTLLAAYLALGPGTETFSAAYRNCPPQSGALSCNSLVRWDMTLEVK